MTIRSASMKNRVLALAAAVSLAGSVLAFSPTSPASAVASATAYQFDFGGPSSPVESGWTGITAGSKYSEATGFGFLTGGETFRDRNAGSNMQRDFIIGAWEFAVDLPNGRYEITSWAGDRIAVNTTNLTLEGVEFAGPRTAINVFHEQLHGPITVEDGQLNITSGGDGRINGLRVRPWLEAPTGLSATVADVVSDPAVTIDWAPIAGASEYQVYRADPDGVLTKIGAIGTGPFTDGEVLLGETYDYTVAATVGDRVTPQSERLRLTVSDSASPTPATPDLDLVSIDANSVELGWAADDAALYWEVYRTTRSDIPPVLLATVTEPAYRDTTDVLTSRAYYYTVRAVGAGGVSSAQLTTPITVSFTRQAEYLDRAPVAVMTDGGVYIGWRLLGLDDRAIGFNIYRDGEIITSEPLTGATNYLDPDGTAQSRYEVTAIIDGREITVTEQFGAWAENHLDIALDKPDPGVTPDGQQYTYSPGDGSVGDLDGDGDYELVLLWAPSNSKDNSQVGYTGESFLDAYDFDGTKLWRIELGPNIRTGAHYTQFQVFDYDGDGRAEVAFRTTDGVIDGVGDVIGDANAVHVNSNGFVLTNPEYLTVFDGLTGAALDTEPYAPSRGVLTSWGSGPHDLQSDRFLAGTAFLDGTHPSLIFARGYYFRTTVAAWDFRDGQLTRRWLFDSRTAGRQYDTQGNHQLSVADVDRDGLDEIVYGAMTLDEDGTVLYSTGLRHGDALHVADHIPSRPGLEVFSTFEYARSNGGVETAMRDAETGEVLWKTEGSDDIGRGVAADIDPRHEGSEAWAPTTPFVVGSTVGRLSNSSGAQLGTTTPDPNFVTWWDGDLLREITNSDFDSVAATGTPTVSKWNWDTNRSDLLWKADGTRTNNGTKQTPVLQADLFGDWREELIFGLADGSGVRVLTTTDSTDHRIPTLMHDPVYRLGVAWQNTAYNQPPHTSFYLGVGMAEPPTPKIVYVNAPALDSTQPVISGLPDGYQFAQDRLQLDITAEDAESGVRSLQVTIGGVPIDPKGIFDPAGLSGPVEVTVSATNHAGLVTTANSTLTVLAKAATAKPGRAVLSNTSGRAYGLHDGNYDVVMNLWWGVPGALYRLYENGTLLTTVQVDDSGNSQSATIPVRGRHNGTYVYTAELINSKGTTQTSSTTVTVNAAAPGKPALSSDNWDQDGNFVLTANLWWGTNATSYQFTLDGEIVGSGPLTAASPGPQKAVVALTGVAKGNHIATVVFINDAGETSSAPLNVVVTK